MVLHIKFIFQGFVKESILNILHVSVFTNYDVFVITGVTIVSHEDTLFKMTSNRCRYTFPTKMYKIWEGFIVCSPSFTPKSF